MILKLRAARQVRGRIDSRERAEVVDEVGLIEISRFQRDVCPIRRIARVHASQHVLEPLHAAEALGSQPDLFVKKLRKAARAQADLSSHFAYRPRECATHE